MITAEEMINLINKLPDTEKAKVLRFLQEQ